MSYPSLPYLPDWFFGHRSLSLVTGTVGLVCICLYYTHFKYQHSSKQKNLINDDKKNIHEIFIIGNDATAGKCLFYCM